MDNLLVDFIIFDVLMLYLIYRFMAKKLNSKLELVDEHQRKRWARDEEKLKAAFEEEYPAWLTAFATDISLEV